MNCKIPNSYKRKTRVEDMQRDAHRFSAASMLMASMMVLTFSMICLALIVCCSNFVFTADCEIHSCEATTHKFTVTGTLGAAGPPA